MGAAKSIVKSHPHVTKAVAGVAATGLGAGIGAVVAAGTGAILGGVIGCGLVALAVGIHFLYYRRSDGRVSLAKTEEPLTQEQIFVSSKFQPISMTDQQFNNLRSFTMEYYSNRVKKFICPVTLQVMRQPCMMKCCQNKPREDKHADRSVIEYQIKHNGRCVLCQSPATAEDIVQDEDKSDAIYLFRQRLVKTYLNSAPQTKEIFRELVDYDFGPGYTSQYLDNFTFEVNA